MNTWIIYKIQESILFIFLSFSNASNLIELKKNDYLKKTI